MSDSLSSTDCAERRRFWKWGHANSDASPLAGLTFAVGYECLTDVCVKLNDESGPMPLIEGTDYTIDADEGTITFTAGGATSMFIADSNTVDVWFNVVACMPAVECRTQECCGDAGDTVYVSVRPPNCVPVPMVTFSPASGSTQSFPLTVTLTVNRTDAVIYYTTDGSEPTTGSTEYTAPFAVSSAAIIVKAMGVVPGCSQGETAVAQWLAADIHLLSYWKFEEASNATRLDSKGTANLSDVNGNIPRAAGKVSFGAEQTGLGNFSLLENTNVAIQYASDKGFTICGWWKLTADDNGTVLYMEDAGPTAAPHIEIQQLFGGEMQFNYKPSNAGVVVSVQAPYPIGVGFHFFRFWLDPVDWKVRVQWDLGTTETPSAASVAPTIKPTYYVSMGPSGGSGWVIDEVGFWEGVLSDTDAAYLYNSGTGRTYPSVPYP